MAAAEIAAGLNKLAGQSHIQLSAGLVNPRHPTAQSVEILPSRRKSFNKVIQYNFGHFPF